MLNVTTHISNWLQVALFELRKSKHVIKGGCNFQILNFLWRIPLFYARKASSVRRVTYPDSVQSGFSECAHMDHYTHTGLTWHDYSINMHFKPLSPDETQKPLS